MHVLTCFPKITYGDCIQKTTWQSGLWEFCWNEEGIEEGMGLFLECWEKIERERERVWRYCWEIGARNYVCWETVERLLRDCWGSGSVERVFENCCWETVEAMGVRECCETVDRTKTSLNSLQHPQQHSSDITPTILKHLTESFKNISQTSLKHLSTSHERLSNISQTSLNNTHQHPSNNLRQHHPNNNKPELSASTGRKACNNMVMTQ